MKKNNKIGKNIYKQLFILVFICCWILLILSFILFFLYNKEKNKSKETIEISKEEDKDIIIESPTMEYREKIIEKPIYIDREVEKIVTIETEIPKEIIKEVEIEKIIEKPVEVIKLGDNKIFYNKDFSPFQYGLQHPGIKKINKHNATNYESDKMGSEEMLKPLFIKSFYDFTTKGLFELKKNDKIHKKIESGNQTYYTGYNLYHENIFDGKKFHTNVLFENNKIIYFFLQRVDDLNIFTEFLFNKEEDIIKCLKKSDENKNYYDYTITNTKHEMKSLEIFNMNDNMSLVY